MDGASVLDVIVRCSLTQLQSTFYFLTCLHHFLFILVPSAAPANVTGESITSKLLRIKWKPVPGNGVPSCCVHGVLTGYKVWWGKRYPVPGECI